VLDGFQRGVVAIGQRQFDELARVGQAAAQFGQGFDDVFEGFLFTAQVLGVLGVVPDGRVFELGIYDLQAF